jgi:signal transduction histidine kinase
MVATTTPRNRRSEVAIPRSPTSGPRSALAEAVTGSQASATAPPAIGFVDLLDEQPELEELSRNLVRRLRRSLGRMTDLITDVLQWSTTAQRAPEPGTVELERVVAAVAGDHPDGLVSTAGPLPTLVTDTVLIAQVVRNLVGNAVTNGGRATVGAEATEGGMRLWVDDEGPGIDPADRELVFEPFRRGRTSSGTEGTGMGLAIVRRAVARLGGHVTIASAPGGGARLVVEVPAAG